MRRSPVFWGKMLDLILKDIQDPYTRENFFRIKEFIDPKEIFEGDFKLFDISINRRYDSFKILHGLTFIPADIINLSAFGDNNYYFRFQDFDRDAMYVTTNGPVRIRFLAGKLRDPVTSNNRPFPFVAPGDVLRPSSPGFTYGGIGFKTSGFWLTSEGIPSNTVGIPVLFGDAAVTQAAVGTGAESNYTIGVYQHEGAGLNLLQIGTFSVTIGGVKRFDINFPITYSSPNVQLAARLESGSTSDLKVSLIVRGTGA